MSEPAAVDPAELVGRGGYPLRIEPAAALAPGSRDPARLMAVWCARKSFTGLACLGLVVGALLALLFDDSNTIELRTSPGSVNEALVTGSALLLAALGVRVATAWAALALAYPLARAHEVNLPPQTARGGPMGDAFDRLRIARAFRELRWSRHVRAIALSRLGPDGGRWGRIDRAVGVANRAAIAAAGLSFLVLAVVPSG